MEFSIQRTLDVLVRKLCINRKSILIFLGIFFLIPLTLYFIEFLKYGAHNMGILGLSLSIRVVLPMIIIAGIFPFLEITNKQNAVFELMYPASKLEKFVIEALTCFIILPIIILVIDILAFYGGALAGKLYFLRYGLSYSLPDFCNIFLKFTLLEYGDYLLIFGFITISFFGAILFKKYRLLKIWLCVGLIVLTIIIITSIILVKYYDAESTLFLRAENILNNSTLWNVIGTIFFLGVFFATWILYKNKRA